MTVLSIENFNLLIERPQSKYRDAMRMRISYPNVKIKAGDIVEIHGGNGTGKSSLLKAISLVDFYDKATDYKVLSGSISFPKDEVLNGYNTLLANNDVMAYLRQKIAFLGPKKENNERFTFYDFLVEPSILALHSKKILSVRWKQASKKEAKKDFKKSQAFIEDQCKEIFEHYLKDFLYIDSFERLKHTFIELDLMDKASQGQKQFLSFFAHWLKAMIISDFLLLDEPFSNLDENQQNSMIALIKKLRSFKPNMTIFIIAHNHQGIINNLITKRLEFIKKSQQDIQVTLRGLV